MKKLFVLILALPLLSFAQDVITTSTGNITITPILHGTVVLEFSGKTIYVDPYGGAEKFAKLKKPDLVLITDIHGDHLHQATLDGLDLSSATLIVPQAVADKLTAGTGKKVEVLANNQTTLFGWLKITAVPMYNLPETEDSRHPKGRGNGYIIELGSTRIYLSGDTGDIQEMRSLKEIDVAFVCMNLPYTMDVTQAASAVAAFKPTIVYPYHYRGEKGLSDIEQFKKLVNADAPAVDVRLRNWYPEK